MSEGTGAGRRLVGDTIVYGLALGIARALAFLLLPVLTRAFTAAEYGIYDLLTTFNRALFVPAVLGMDAGIALMIQEGDERDRRRVVTSCLVAQLAWVGAIALVIVLFAPALAARFLGGADRADLVVIAAVLLALVVVGNFTSNLAKWKREPGRYLLLLVGTAALSAACVAALVLGARGGVYGAILGMVLGAGVLAPVGLALTLRHMRPAFALADVVRCVRLGVPFAATGVSELLFPFIVRLILLDVAGLGAVGVFGAANTICLGVMLINDAFASAWAPYALSPEAAGRVREDTVPVMRVYGFLLILMVAAVVLLAEPLVGFLLGGGAFFLAAQVVGPLAFAYWFKSMRQMSGIGLMISGRLWLRAWLNLATMIVSVAFAWVLTVKWGIEGTAWGFAAGEASGLAILTAVLHRSFGRAVDYRSVVLTVLLFVLLMVAKSFLPSLAPGSDSIGASLVLRTGLGAAFAAALMLLHVVRPQELRGVIFVLRGFLVRRGVN